MGALGPDLGPDGVFTPFEAFCVDKSCLIVEMLSPELQTPSPDSSSQNPEFIRENVDLQTNY